MVFMAAYEGPDQTEAEEYITDDENDDLNEPKSFYMVPMSFVIHTYSRVRQDSMLSEQPFSPYRHKVTMFKVTCVVTLRGRSVV